ncbi:MAG: FGGY-family carbohydrate kinase [Anaerolineae bacterium]|nr:FGGY-family carbohydrate kinase [Anaerolineae bacterium]
MTDLLLGIDVGTTAAKAALIGQGGQVEAVHQAGYRTHYLRPGWVEQHPEDWWDAVCVAVRAVLAQTPGASDRVAGLAVSSQAPALIALDRLGQVLRPALIWMDRRAEAEARQIRDSLGCDRVFQITGNRPDPYFMAAKVLWFRNHEPHLLAQTHQFVQVNGYINYRLTGQIAVDPTHAALMQLWQRDGGAWSAELCEACGLDEAQLPACCPAHHVLGAVTPSAAQATGLRPGTPVLVGMIDAVAAALEAGVTDAGTAAEMTGTSTVLMIPNRSGMTEPSLIATPHVVPDVHLLVGAIVASGASLNWYREQFGLIEQQASALLGADAFDLLTQQAARIAPGSDGVIFLPYMMGERSPLWHTNARGVLFGLSLGTSRGAIIRAILEGTVFALLHNIQTAQEAGAVVQELRSVGGGTRSALWNQMKADILGVPILLPEAPIGAPFGDAMLVGMSLGLFPDLQDTLAQIVQIRTVYQPNPEHRAVYQAIFRLFRTLYVHLREDFDEAAAIYAAEKPH